ncbi:MAG: HNH endonuclease [Nitrosopumilaceae archaeon]|nr:HNH endonuclease [Nitrosopumilaceae archaeon]
MGKATGSKTPRICPCGRRARNAGLGPDGLPRYGVLCKSCNSHNLRDKKNYCENCGFIPQIPQQIEIDHRDGNKRNNARENLWSLCCNCHRLKTVQNSEWRNQYV